MTNEGKPNNPLNDDDKSQIKDDITNTTNDIKQRVLEQLEKDKQASTPTIPPAEPSPAVDTAAIEEQVRAKLLAEMKSKMEAEAKAIEAKRVQDSVSDMASQLEQLKNQLEAKNKPSNVGQEVSMSNPFNSEGKKFEELTQADEDSIDRASEFAFEQERRFGIRKK